MATIIIPTALRKFTNNAEMVTLSATNVLEALQQLVRLYPDLRQYLFTDSGNISSFLNIFLENTDVRDLEEEETLIAEVSVISIIPAIAGG